MEVTKPQSLFSGEEKTREKSQAGHTEDLKVHSDNPESRVGNRRCCKVTEYRLWIRAEE